MYDNVKQCLRGSNVRCGSCSQERILFGVLFRRSRTSNGSNADMCSDVAGPSSSGSGDLFAHSDRSDETIILLIPPPLAGRRLRFEHGDYNSHTAFGAC